jgi:ABC-2 type transport system ATP-binding protein
MLDLERAVNSASENALDTRAPVIEVRDLKKTYPTGVEAVKGITFNVKEGEFFGFLGPNGAGKSTSIKILITLLAKTDGLVQVLGMDVDKHTDEVRRVIGYAAQDASTDDDLNGIENLDIQGHLYGLERKLIKQRTEELIDLMDLREAAKRRVGTYSGGMKKRLDLATALIHRPRILFLDEPTTGLDPQNRAGLWRYLEKVNKEEKLTIFLTTHYMEEADRLCDRLAIIDGGKIIAEDSPTALKAGMGGDVISLNFKGNGVSAAEQAEKAKSILESEEFIRTLRLGEGENTGSLSVVVQNGGEVVPEVLRLLDSKNLRVASLNLTSPTLDDVFLKFTGQRIRQEDPVKYNGRAPWMRKAPR